MEMWLTPPLSYLQSFCHKYFSKTMNRQGTYLLRMQLGTYGSYDLLGSRNVADNKQMSQEMLSQCCHLAPAILFPAIIFPATFSCRCWHFFIADQVVSFLASFIILLPTISFFCCRARRNYFVTNDIFRRHYVAAMSLATKIVAK